ncbi:MAG: FMN-binding negative transcriptional regulator [Pseudomonadota bacterium]|nr:FMN-binding negative transcriptional regulator [Pseudomonadota bacterium]
MSVYQPPSFVPRDAAPMEHVIRDYPFATLVTARAPEPQISHLPLLFHSAPEPNGVLIGHMARANPHWRRFADGPTVALFHGPHAYVSPSWYAEPEKAVPTWNYAVVHVHARVELVEDRAVTLAILHEMIERFESGRAAPWRLQLEGQELKAMVNAIVAFRLLIERVDTKLKLSQNRSVTDRQRVVAALRAERTAEASATADWMQPYAGEA